MKVFLSTLLMGCAVASLLIVGPAHAQSVGGGIDPGEPQSSGLPSAGTGVLDPGKPDTGDQQPPSGDDDKSKTPAPPPSLPGSHTQPDAVAPAARTLADLDPTALLFDAINRGDTLAARDAVNRGANLDGKNVLGLTPIELSVDLNRNDISFLLLSMRGSGTQGAGGALKVTPVKLARGRQTTLAKAGVAAAASDPSSGFLGFDHGGS